MKKCIACGMPMKEASDFPLGDKTKDYCIYCARSDGSMQSYEEKLNGTMEFLMKTQGIKKENVKEVAERTLKALPAWNDLSEKNML